MKYFTCLLASLILAGSAAVAQAKQKPADRKLGKVVKVVDGDTFSILVNDSTLKVRMEGIDAPEAGQEYYEEARQALSDMVLDKEVWMQVSGKDKYGRCLAIVNRKTDNLNINKQMVRLGMAWHFIKYSDDKELALLEKQAKEKGIGLWSLYHFTEPWEYRKNN